MVCDQQDQGDALTGLVVDHDHATRRCRGLLCGVCNRALHFVERHGHGDAWLRRVHAYLRTPEQREQLWKLFDQLDEYLGWLGASARLQASRGQAGAITARIRRIERLLTRIRVEAGVPAEDYYAFLWDEHRARIAAEGGA